MPRQMLSRLLLLAALVLPLGLSSITPSHAGVNLKNGNFYISYTDLVSPPPESGQIRGEIKIVRTYNSHATEMGWFGYGWGSELETFVSFNGEGGITIHENGSGSLRNITETSRAAAGERVVELFPQAYQNLPERRAGDSEIVRWQGDYEQRLAYTISYLDRGLESPRHPPLGWKRHHQLTCNDKNCKRDHGFTISRTPEGFLRRFVSGKSEYFDTKGRLVLIRERNGYFVRMEFDETGAMRRLIDVNGYEMRFDWTHDGKVRRIEDSKGRSSRYTYEGRNLIRSEDGHRNIYLHQYDAISNMTAVRYSDATELGIRYNDKGFTNKVSNRDGSIVNYEYGADPKDPAMHFWTIVKQQDPAGTILSDNRYEYKIAGKPDGTRYTNEIIVEKKSENLREVSVFAPNGQTITKDTNGKITRYSYHPRYEVLDAEMGPDKEVRYEFDPERRLVRAIIESTPGSEVSRTVRFDYSQDREQMLEMTDMDGNTYRFIHDDRGQVVAIDLKDRQVVLNRNRFGTILSAGFKEGPLLDFNADAKMETYGFSLGGDADDAYRKRLRDVLHTIKRWTDQTYFPPIIETD